MLTQSRVERVLHSILASRVLLHIRAQAGTNPGWGDGLTELTQINFHCSETESNG
jgi:hypothetical protein